MENSKTLRYEEVVWLKHKVLPYLKRVDRIKILPSDNTFYIGVVNPEPKFRTTIREIYRM